ncbi:MAG: serine/threonine-protein kinase [Syntrophomonadaceae bacterium]
MLKKNMVLSTAFEEYTILEQIKQGGNGTVFLAESADNDKVAIKAIDRNTTTKDKVKRFKNEINFCQKNRHPNIIQVIDYGVFNDGKLDCLFYVMLYYPSTLRDEIKRGIEPKNIVEIFGQILSGVEFAHKQGVWHRDLKPENILFDSKSQNALVADFGIAHFCSEDIITSVETKMGERLANYLYAAPEQRVRGGSVDGRADIFALGLILNEMFTNTVISGSQFKKISDISSEFGFLDKVVEQMIVQNQTDRLFPIEKIWLEINALMKIESSKTELRSIAERQIDESQVEDPLFIAPQLQRAEFNDERLFLHLDKKTNAIWDNILIAGRYGKQIFPSYPTNAFVSEHNSETDTTTFKVTIRTENRNPQTIETIINLFKSWLPSASEMYKQKVKAQRAESIQRQIEERERALREKETEIRINEKIKSLL